MIDPALVLVVDDDDSTREMLTMALLDEGYRVEAAFDGDAALARIDARRPDLVLMDVRMPGLSGEELLQLLRERHPGLPVVLTSADPRLVHDATARGAAGVLVKPFDLDDLLVVVERALAGPDLTAVGD